MSEMSEMCPVCGRELVWVILKIKYLGGMEETEGLYCKWCRSILNDEGKMEKSKDLKISREAGEVVVEVNYTCARGAEFTSTA